MSSLGPRDRRALVIGALMLTPVLTWRGIASPYREWVATQRTRTASAAALFAREQTLLRDSTAIRTALRDAQQRLTAPSDALFAGEDSTAVTATVIAWLHDAAHASRLTNIRVEPAAAEPDAGILWTVRADFYAKGSSPALAEWLRRCAQGQHVVAVQQLDVNTENDGTILIHAQLMALGREVRP